VIVDAIVRHRAVTAVRWTGEPRDSLAVQRLVHMVLYKHGALKVPAVGRLAMSGVAHCDSQTVRPGDWIVKIEEGVFLVCESAVFERLFEIQAAGCRS
jgi:hypothetical protein